MAEDITEYTVRDYSPVDRQIDEIARRERILTNRLRLENLKRLIFISLLAIGGICLLALAFAIAYRIAFPPEKKIVEKVIVKEKIKDIPQSKTPSNKVFGIPNNNSNIKPQIKLDNNKTQSNKIFGIPDNNSNIKPQTKPEKKSKLDKTEVVTFKKSESPLTGFITVTTGWKWNNPQADKPYREFCYTHNLDNVRIDLARKENNIKDSLYDYYTADKYNLTKNQWDQMVNECQWFKG